MICKDSNKTDEWASDEILIEFLIRILCLVSHSLSLYSGIRNRIAKHRLEKFFINKRVSVHSNVIFCSRDHSARRAISRLFLSCCQRTQVAPTNLLKHLKRIFIALNELSYKSFFQSKSLFENQPKRQFYF